MRRSLKTKRLSLDPLTLDDKDEIIDQLISDAEVMKFLLSPEDVATHNKRNAVASMLIGESIELWEREGIGCWAIRNKDTELGSIGQLVGYCGCFSGQIENAGPEVGTVIARKYWRKGVMNEVGLARWNWLFTETTIEKCHIILNAKHKAIANWVEKLGIEYLKDVEVYGSVKMPCYLVRKKDLSKIRISLS